MNWYITSNLLFVVVASQANAEQVYHFQTREVIYKFESVTFRYNVSM